MALQIALMIDNIKEHTLDADNLTWRWLTKVSDDDGLCLAQKTNYEVQSGPWSPVTGICF